MRVQTVNPNYALRYTKLYYRHYISKHSRDCQQSPSHFTTGCASLVSTLNSIIPVHIVSTNLILSFSFFLGLCYDQFVRSNTKTPAAFNTTHILLDVLTI